MQRYRLLFLVSITCLGLSTQAWANGRFPRSQRLIRDPADPQHMVLAGTFGLAVTQDGGDNWVHVCESAFTDPNTIVDPLVAFTKSQTLFTGTVADLRRSDPGGCEFDVVLGEPGILVPDYTLDVDGESVLALVSTTVGAVEQATVQSSADGDTWQALGPAIEGVSALTLDVAPMDSERLYISALAPRVDGPGQRGVLLTSRDRGQTWTESEIPGTSLDAQPFIAALHPTDPDTLYVRLDARKLDALDLAVADDALLVTRDAGQTWEELIRKPAKLFAFALSPDATTVLVGFGTPDDATVSSENNDYGLYRLTLGEPSVDGGPGGAEIEHLLELIPVHCLTWTDEGLYVCLKQFEAGFELGFTSDHGFSELEELTPILLLNHVEGPSSCEMGTEAGACADRWETDCLRLFACGTPGAAGASGGTGGAVGMVAGSSGTAGGGAAELPPKKESSCGCRLLGTAQAPRTGADLTLAWLLALGLVWRRQRPKA